MAFPKPVPSLNSEEFEQFRQELDEYEASEEMKEDIQRHLSLLENEDQD